MASLYEKRFQELTKPELLNRYFVYPEFADSMSESRLAEFQKDALQEVVSRAFENSPFYRQKMTGAGVAPQDIAGLAELAKLPFTTKEELRGNPWALLACDKKDITCINVSTGTTGGEQIYIMYTWRDYYITEMSAGYPSLFPIEPGDICLNALPFEMSSAGLAFHKTFEGCLATAVPAGKGGAYSTPEKPSS
jgi:phenylacetate-CoA ligase